jgi:hypothetical protein
MQGLYGVSNEEQSYEPPTIPQQLQDLIELAYEYQGVLMIIPPTDYSATCYRIKHAESFGNDLDQVYEDLIAQLDARRGRHTS